jgi:hypothetical protein
MASLASASASLRHGSGTTAPPPVVISGISSGTPTASTATITWTNTPATALGQVCYGAPNGPPNVYGTCTARDTVPIVPDTATLIGLAASSTYHYQINATATGHTQGFSSPDQSFTTAAGSVVCTYPTAPIDGCGVSPGIFLDSPWPALAKQSGQTWASSHPQPWNMAAIDYGVGPNAARATMTDIASWPAGRNQCTYYASGVNALSGLSAYPSTYPALVCTGATQADFTITGYNFGPTAYQDTPNGSHDCVPILVSQSNTTTYAPNITIKGNYFINGATCAPKVSGVNYGIISENRGSTKGSLKIWNNYVDGRNSDPCCNFLTQAGFIVATNNAQNNVDFEFNWVVNAPTAPLLFGWLPGNESSCSNGTAYTLPGYNLTVKYNYFKGFGYSYGNGHWEIHTFGTAAVVCSIEDEYNTVVWTSSQAGEGTTTFFYMTGNTGFVEWGEVDHNTIVTNLIGGAQYPNIYEYVNLTTSNPIQTPTYLTFQASGSLCAGAANPWPCVGFRTGQGIISAGTGNAADVVGVQDNVSGNNWNGGCNGPGLSILCPHSGNYPALAGSVGPYTWINGLASNRVVSVAVASGGHGNGTNTTVTAGTPSNGSTTLRTITLNATCPGGNNLLSGGTNIFDTSQGGAYVGAGQTCSGTTLTLFANALVTVGNGDILQARGAAYGQMSFHDNYVDGGASNAAAANTTMTANGASSGSSIAVTLCSVDFAIASVYDVTQAQGFLGTATGCTANALTMSAPVAFTVNNSDVLRIHDIETWYSMSDGSWTGGGYAAGGAGGCRSPTTLSGNIDLRTGLAVNKSILMTGGC